MRIVRYGEGRAGVVDGDEIVDAGTDVLTPRPDGARVRLEDATLLPPVAAPGKIVCAGLNYRDHAEESGMPIP